MSHPLRIHPSPNEACWCGSGNKYKRCHRDSDMRVRNGAIEPGVRPGRISPPREVPAEIVRPEYALTGRPSDTDSGLVLTPEQLVRMRKACKVAAEVLREVSEAVRPGLTTDDVDVLAHEACLRRNAYPSPLNYRGFPKSVCTSVNEIVCHGIPDSSVLVPGDLLKVDVTVFVEGMHGDTCGTVIVGGPDKTDDTGRRLVQVAWDCRAAGIAAVQPGRPISDIGKAITATAAAARCEVVRSYGGHGIGPRFHNALHVPHHLDPQATTLMRPGMTFTVEPMINLGTWKIRQWNDTWTVSTADGKRTAQFEHTVLVTDTGVEILTQP